MAVDTFLMSEQTTYAGGYKRSERRLNCLFSLANLRYFTENPDLCTIAKEIINSVGKLTCKL